MRNILTALVLVFWSKPSTPEQLGYMQSIPVVLAGTSR